MFLADPIEVVNHFVFAFTGVTLICVASNSRKDMLVIVVVDSRAATTQYIH